ncbi:hypothetical protein BGX30_007362 [Mortierella sp. GBA39]|nr:hypothetical protein BGX30_007362 [Mortierella sp. GBA39]
MTNVTLYDISQGNYGLTEKYKHCVRKHAEVLALPFINPQAIQIYSYDDLTRPFKNSLRQSLMTLEQQQSLIVNAIYNDLPGGSHCQEHGHNDDDCEKLHHWFAKEEDIERYYSSWCSYCRERDHNYDDCDKLHHWFAKEEDIERYYSSWCSYCSERGHNYDDCDKLHHWIATEEEIELYDSIWCSYCSERGHNDDDCEKLHHWITTEEEIELYNSFWWE